MKLIKKVFCIFCMMKKDLDNLKRLKIIKNVFLKLKKRILFKILVIQFMISKNIKKKFLKLNQIFCSFRIIY